MFGYEEAEGRQHGSQNKSDNGADEEGREQKYAAVGRHGGGCDHRLVEFLVQALVGKGDKSS